MQLLGACLNLCGQLVDQSRMFLPNGPRGGSHTMQVDVLLVEFGLRGSRGSFLHVVMGY